MSQKMPPWLAEKIKTYQQTQTNMQNIQMQLQRIELDTQNTKKALEILEKTPDDRAVYKEAGSIMVQSDKTTLKDYLEEEQELLKTQVAVLTKQSKRIEDTLREQEAGINQAIQGGAMNPGS